MEKHSCSTKRHGLQTRAGAPAQHQCTLKSSAGPGSPSATLDTFVRVLDPVPYEFTGTYNAGKQRGKEEEGKKEGREEGMKGGRKGRKEGRRERKEGRKEGRKERKKERRKEESVFFNSRNISETRVFRSLYYFCLSLRSTARLPGYAQLGMQKVGQARKKNNKSFGGPIYLSKERMTKC